MAPAGWHDGPMGTIDVDAFEDAWDGDGAAPMPRGRPQASVAAQRRRASAEVGRVLAVDRGQVEVLLGETVVEARYGGAVRGTKLVVGDLVHVAPGRHEGEAARVVGVLERTTVLARTGDDLDPAERIVVANADAIACVVAVDNLELGLRFADRVLVAASLGGLSATLVVNKVDLADDAAATDATAPDRALPDREAVARAVAPYRAAVEHLVLTSTATGEGVDALRATLAGRWTAFTGHSGVGKTSLFNRLVPEATRRVGAVGRRGGRHTTVAAVAMALPDGTGWLVDTPGVRSFGLGTLTDRDLWRHVPELAGLACALDDCVHDGEPGCRVSDAAIDPVRLAAYRRLLAALRDGG